MSIGHLCVCFGEISIRVHCPFIYWVVFCVCVLNFVSSLYILDINPLSDVLVNFLPFCVVFLFCQWFPLQCKTFLVWCSPICLLFSHLFPALLPFSEPLNTPHLCTCITFELGIVLQARATTLYYRCWHELVSSWGARAVYFCSLYTQYLTQSLGHSIWSMNLWISKPVSE